MFLYSVLSNFITMAMDGRSIRSDIGSAYIVLHGHLCIFRRRGWNVDVDGDCE